MEQRRHSSESASASPAITSARGDRPHGREPGARGFTLNAATLALLDTLPSTLRLIALRRGYPHVLVRLAAVWSDPLRMLVEFRSLLEGDRPHRTGFPPEVSAELRQLADYYFRIVHPGLHGLYCPDA
ncbi:MAG: hypothetical protein QM766_27445 [Burkholderiaceae bacterium]